MGIGIGLVWGIVVFDKPRGVFSRGLARRKGFTGLEAAGSGFVDGLVLSVMGFTAPFCTPAASILFD